MKRLPVQLFGPSLARRIVVALLAAFLLVFAALAAKGYWAVAVDELSVTDRAIKTLADGFADSFAGIRDETRAADAALVIDEFITRASLERGDAVIPYWKLLDAQGRPVYSSRAIATLQIPNGPGQFSTQRGVGAGPLAGRPLRTYRSDTLPWSILVAIQGPEDATLWRWFFGDMLEDMLIAFPLVLIPILFAVLTGLRPLRQLSRHIEDRGMNDLSPLRLNPRQAELKPLVAAINGLLARLEASVKQEQAFVHDAAHELQTPLAGVCAQAHVLSIAGSDEERNVARRHLEQIIARASHVIGQLLQLARLDSRVSGPSRDVDLARVVRDKLAHSALPALSGRIDLSLAAPETLPVNIDVVAFRAILDNLVDNALRYVPAGGRVQVRLDAGRGWLQLDVADDGPGIPAVERERIFERFYRIPGQDTPGSGLGLAIARQAAVQLGGTIQAGPGLDGRGCGFQVRIPVSGQAVATPA
ncbi:ATP-binding protein [Silanimonas sp.]|jgi:signal transduction histidine kinase|uniref:sensor histidine kinase n=1 Tax=Silanimonas sp. TaxID=1929290 RepID=UPI0022C27E1B|nr:ATP-binding protein [Silanimonas sp.]MCZ8116428.1 ATP-binding protein [Silanimonas sp.]